METSQLLKEYTYNPLGNTLTKGSASTAYSYQGTTTGSYANPHAVTKVRATVYTYDNNGNVTSVGGKATSTWDYGNRLTGMSQGATTTTYGYDHSGQRVTYAVNGNTTLYPNKLFNIETVGATTSTTTHIFLGDDVVATVEKVGTTTTTHHIHSDHLGSTNVVTGDGGEVLQIIDYYPYGSKRLEESSDVSQREYIGEMFDEDTNLSYLNARYLDSAIAKFRSVDPVFMAVGTSRLKEKTGLELQQYLADPQGFNSYGYARNNPLKYVDTNGEWWETVIDLISLALSAYDFNHNPGIGTGFWLALDIGGTAAPIPSPGLVKNGARTLKIAKYFGKVSNDVGHGINGVVNIGELFVKNINFNFSQRAWSAGEAGNDVASFVGHFYKHGSLLGIKSVDEYYQAANNFIDSGNGAVLPTAGDRIEIWDSANNILAVTNKNGDTIRSFYKVDRQPVIDSLNARLKQLKK